MSSEDPQEMFDLVEQLSGNRRLLGRFLDTVGDALFAVDTAKNITWWNRAGDHMEGSLGELK